MFGKKKDSETYQEIPALIGQGDDYHIYHMSLQDRILAFIVGFGLIFLVVYLFFKSVILALIASVFGGMYANPIYQNMKKEKRKVLLIGQFRDMLESLTSSYSAGKNTLESFIDCRKEMAQLYGEEADISKELVLIVGGMQNNINIEDLLINFAMRSGIEDVQNFADVFRVAVRQGANIRDIISSTRDIISDKIEVEMEINTIMAGNKNELNIMMIMPLIIIVCIQGMGMGGTDNSLPNIIVKIVALCMFGFAYYLGSKFTKINL